MGYLVTGGTGFVGAYVIRALVQDTEQVIAYDIMPDKERLDRLFSIRDVDIEHLAMREDLSGIPQVYKGGMGMVINTWIVKHPDILNGTIELVSSSDKETRFRVKFPIV